MASYKDKAKGGISSVVAATERLGRKNRKGEGKQYLLDPKKRELSKN